MIRRRTIIGIAAAAALWLAPFPAPGGGAEAAEIPTIVATTAMVGDVARAVAGDAARVEVLLGEGVDPHVYKPTRADIARLMAGDVVLYNGLLLEGTMTEALSRIARSGRPVVAVAEGIDKSFFLEPDGHPGQYDPHVWMDVRGWMEATAVVRDALTLHLPDHAPVFERNAGRYLEDLRELNAYAKRVLASVPEDRRVLVTAHDAFGYFGRAYGFEVHGIQGISTESEAGLRHVEELVGLLVDRRIPAVFIETTVPDRNVRALIEGAAARGHRVEIGGALFSDAMGAPGTYEGTYAGMIDHNVTTIAWALGGSVPEGGMAGRLAAATGGGTP